MRLDYTRKDMVQALRSSGVERGDTVFTHVSLGRLGFGENCESTESACRQLLEVFTEVLGEEGTLLAPSYTASFGKREVFDVEKTPANTGPFPEYLRGLPYSCRSADPMSAVVGVGARTRELLEGLAHTTYGPGSFYDRLRRAGGKIVTVGVSLYWATFRHHIEELVGVPFRYTKLFTGRIRDAGGVRNEYWEYYAAILQKNCEPDGRRLEGLARDAEICKVEKLGRSEIVTIPCEAYFDFAEQHLRADPWLSAAGPPLAVEELVKREADRVGEAATTIIDTITSAHEIVRTLGADRRYVVSAATDGAMQAIARYSGLGRRQLPTGSKIGNWIIPERWTLRSATVHDQNGNPVCDAATEPLAVVANSQPVSGKFNREELLARVHVHPADRDAIHFKEFIYERDWGFCLRKSTASNLPDGNFDVSIDCDFSYGFSGHLAGTIKGRGDSAVLLFADIGLPAQPNSGLAAGVAVAEVFRRLRTMGDILSCDLHCCVYSGTASLLGYLAEAASCNFRLGLKIETPAIAAPHAAFLQAGTQLDASAKPPGVSLSTCDAMVLEQGSSPFSVPATAFPLVALGRTQGDRYADLAYTSDDTLEVYGARALEETVGLLLDWLKAFPLP